MAAAAAAEEEDSSTSNQPKLPQKRYFRQRAHVNIFNDMRFEYPVRPEEQDWSKQYPTYFRPVSESPKESETGPAMKRPPSPSGTVDNKASGSNKRGPAATVSETEEIKNKLAQVEFADIGCGYGGLLVALAPLYPNTLMVGMEIRGKLVNYLQQRIEALRAMQKNLLADPSSEWVDVRSKLSQEIAQLHSGDNSKAETEEELHDNGETTRLVPGHYENIASMRINCQKYLPNFFQKAQLSKLFILFADPHFKRRKHKARIISTTMLAEYAYVLRVGGIIYMITDVKDLFDWNVRHLDAFPLFERISEDELDKDPAVPCVVNSTEEGKKVARNKGDKYLACYRRIEDPADAKDN